MESESILPITICTIFPTLGTAWFSCSVIPAAQKRQHSPARQRRWPLLYLWNLCHDLDLVSPSHAGHFECENQEDAHAKLTGAQQGN